MLTCLDYYHQAAHGPRIRVEVSSKRGLCTTKRGNDEEKTESHPRWAQRSSELLCFAAELNIPQSTTAACDEGQPSLVNVAQSLVCGTPFSWPPNKWGRGRGGKPPFRVSTRRPEAFQPLRFLEPKASGPQALLRKPLTLNTNPEKKIIRKKLGILEGSQTNLLKTV